MIWFLLGKIVSWCGNKISYVPRKFSCSINTIFKVRIQQKASASCILSKLHWSEKFRYCKPLLSLWIWIFRGRIRVSSRVAVDLLLNLRSVFVHETIRPWTKTNIFFHAQQHMRHKILNAGLRPNSSRPCINGSIVSTEPPLAVASACDLLF